MTDTPPLCARPDCGQPVKHRVRRNAGWYLYCSRRCSGQHAPRHARKANGQKGGIACRKLADAHRCAKAKATAEVMLRRLETLRHDFTDYERKWITAALMKTAREAYTQGYHAGHLAARVGILGRSTPKPEPAPLEPAA